jgi:hypothetical protein
MSRKVQYKNADGEKKVLSKVQNIEKSGNFLRVTYKPFLSDSTKTTNVRKDRVIRYDE